MNVKISTVLLYFTMDGCDGCVILMNVPLVTEAMGILTTLVISDTGGFSPVWLLGVALGVSLPIFVAEFCVCSYQHSSHIRYKV